MKNSLGSGAWKNMLSSLSRKTLPFLQCRLFTPEQTNFSSLKRFCFRAILPLSFNTCKEMVLGAGCQGQRFFSFAHGVGQVGLTGRSERCLSDHESCDTSVLALLSLRGCFSSYLLPPISGSLGILLSYPDS